MNDYDKVLEIVSKVKNKDKRLISKLLRVIDEDIKYSLPFLKSLFENLTGSLVVGITGPLGVGKSSLLNALIHEYRKMDLDIAVIAIDPTSPFSGGAILGDRIRMMDHFGDEKVFIRSIGTRGSLGGISASTYNMINVFDAAGKDIIFVETVGVGQDEVDIVNLSHITILVLIPTAGDDIQNLKAGIMEIPDIFVINKSDLGNSSLIEKDLRNLISSQSEVKGEGYDIEPKVFKTSTLNREGIEDLAKGIIDYANELKEKKLWHIREKRKHRFGLLKMLQRELDEIMNKKLSIASDKEMNLDKNIYEVYEDLSQKIEELIASYDF